MFKFFKLLFTSSEPKSPVRFAASGFGIEPTKEAMLSEMHENALMLKILEQSIINSGHFIPQKIPLLMSVLHKSTQPFAREGQEVVRSGSALSSKEEKRALGLNTRRKYYKEFIDYFNSESLKSIEPICAFESMRIDASNRAHRHCELITYKKIGFIKKITIRPIGGCEAIKKHRKTYAIDDVPELPLKECDILCMCYYEPVIPSR